MARVQLKNVSKRFSSTSLAVDDVSLEIEDHEFLVLVGPSGCGKTTTLRIIAGLERNTDGEVWIGQRRVDEVAPKDRDIAMVFQNYALYPHMSVYKNMSFGLSLRYARRSGIDQQVRQTAKRLGIEHLLDRKPYQLSGGERQRVALGRAIVREPAAFLFDEPLSNLDAKLRQQLRIELKRIHRELNATMIYVTHDQVEAMTLGDRVAVMDEGRILQVGSPLELYQQPANLFVAKFIGNTPINLCSGTVKQTEGSKGGSDFCFAAENGTFNRWLEDSPGREHWQRQVFGSTNAGPDQRNVVIGFRPEDVVVLPNGPSESAKANRDGKSMPFCFAAIVSEIDRLGESTLVHANVIGDAGVSETDSFQMTILARIEPDSNLKPNDRIDLAVPWSQVLWFDQATSKNLLKDEIK
ncbi:UNVERIFIED_CONTAM: hypothetical protein GTU68_018407 [Idotea baltica]|nr:hypothetical protein [Idotea baltica]